MLHKFSSKIIKFFIITILCFAFVAINSKGFFSPLRMIFFEVAYPFQKAFYVVSRNTAEWMHFFSSIGTMQEDNEKLLLENNRLLARIASLQEMKNENDLLREQLQLLPKDNFELEASFVIGQDPQGLGNWLTIGKGSSNGIAIGMPVIISEGILVGRIDEVGPNYARVNLITNTTSAINAIDLETGAKGLLRGSYALGIMMDMISQGDTINNGDMIITSGLGGELPRGLLIGNVQEVRVSSDKLFQQAIIIPAVKYRDLDIVFVIRD